MLLYEKPFVLSYLQNVRRKAQDTIARESAEVLAGPSGFNWRKCSRAELHVYNIRHIQHHAAQLSLRLRLDADDRHAVGEPRVERCLIPASSRWSRERRPRANRQRVSGPQ